jgi:hypothetical protein
MKESVSGSIKGLYIIGQQDHLCVCSSISQCRRQEKRSCRPCRWCLMCVYSPEVRKYIAAADARGVNATQEPPVF